MLPTTMPIYKSQPSPLCFLTNSCNVHGFKDKGFYFLAVSSQRRFPYSVSTFQTVEPRAHLGVGTEEFITEPSEGLQHVGLDSPRRLHGHLGAILQDGHRELGTGHARQPQAKVTVHLRKGRPVEFKSRT